jgi:ankyrin repeat protein
MTDEDGITPLMHAVGDDQPNVVRFLLQHGADPNLTREGSGGALIDSIWVANDPVIANMLLDAGANIDQRTLGKKETALMVAARLDKPTFVKLLVNRGANLDAVNADGDTALKAAQRARASAPIIALLSGRNHSSGTSDRQTRQAPVH